MCCPLKNPGFGSSGRWWWSDGSDCVDLWWMVAITRHLRPQCNISPTQLLKLLSHSWSRNSAQQRGIDFLLMSLQENVGGGGGGREGGGSKIWLGEFTRSKKFWPTNYVAIISSNLCQFFWSLDLCAFLPHTAPPRTFLVYRSILSLAFEQSPSHVNVDEWH